MARFTKTETIELACPACDSKAIVKNGKRDGYQRYKCKACKKKFHAKGTAKGQRFRPDQVGTAIRMFYSGMSYKQIAETMATMYDIPEPSKRAIYSWVKKYTERALDAMEGRKAETGDEWVADEMVVRVGGEKMWNWNVMDSKTRYILASHLSRRRNTAEARKVMRKAAANAARTPKVIKTDKLGSYLWGIEDVFGADTKHVQSEGIRAKLNNNLSERLQGTFRQREKTLRGLDHKESGQLYLDGWVLTYNLFREHEGIGSRPPGDRAKVNAPFVSWEDVVKHTGPKLVVPKMVAEPEVEAKRVEEPEVLDRLKLGKGRRSRRKRGNLRRTARLRTHSLKLR